MTELEAVNHLQQTIDHFLTMPHTQWGSGSIEGPDPQLAWVDWSCWQVRVGFGYNLPDLGGIRVLRVYYLFYLFGSRGGADYDVEVGFSGRSERAKVYVEGIGMNTCRISLYRWANGQRRRIGRGRGVVGVQARTADGLYTVQNLQTMPATAG